MRKPSFSLLSLSILDAGVLTSVTVLMSIAQGSVNRLSTKLWGGHSECPLCTQQGRNKPHETVMAAEANSQAFGRGVVRGHQTAWIPTQASSYQPGDLSKSITSFEPQFTLLNKDDNSIYLIRLW